MQTQNQLAPSILESFTPKSITVLREGYRLDALRADAIAGLTVAIVALPLSMAIAIACGARPEDGLYASIVGGFFLSVFGGSRFQIGGPAGAFIVVVATAIHSFGYEGFLLAVVMAGFFLVLAGLLRLGSFARYVPHPVIVGFTAAVAILIFSSEIKDMFGLHPGPQPAALFPKLAVLARSWATFSPASTALSIGSIILIVALRRWRPKWPGYIVAVAAASVLTAGLHLNVPTLGSVFGAMPQGLNVPHVPHVSIDLIIKLLPTALIFAALGSIESLLSAVVADSMTGRRHRSNVELVAQGIANIMSALFGGLAVTGVVARTAANIRAHAHGPMAGMFHSAFLLLFLVAGGPLIERIPLAALAAVLGIVCWNMADRKNFVALLRHDRSEAMLLLTTFLLTLFTTLTVGIGVGVTLGALTFMHRMAGLTGVAVVSPAEIEENDEDADAALPPHSDKVLVTRIEGPFFFGAASEIGRVLERLGDRPLAFVIDLVGVPLADSSGAQTLHDFIARERQRGAQIYLANVAPKVREVLERAHIGAPLVTFCGPTRDAVLQAVAATSEA
ncbi:MAG: SulP family inorganic anion transporter [Hyphomicrobiales bacterium]|nr:SulP family inorganic anion transporter [Hyphomicrobiales bacterium]